MLMIGELVLLLDLHRNIYNCCHIPPPNQDMTEKSEKYLLLYYF